MHRAAPRRNVPDTFTLDVMRTLLAFLAAAVAPALVMTALYLHGQFAVFAADDPYIWIRTRGFLLLCLAISSGHAALLGVPVYAVLRWRNAIRWWSILAASFVLAALPFGLFAWPLRYSDLKSSAWSDGVELMADGVPTAAGWFQYAQGVAFFGACGAFGGLIFWLVWRNGREARRSD